MKKITFFTLAIFSIMLIACNVNQKKEGELPEVDVDVDAEAGELPEYEVNWADVNVGTNTRTVEIPKVVVVMEEETVEVPYIDVDMPNEESEERTIVVEAEVSGKEHDLEIKEIRASDRMLYVISMLEEMNQELGDKTIRIQDQVDLNAPDLSVKHIIVGTKADRIFNNQYTYVSSMNDLDAAVQDAQVIYSR